MSTPRQRLAALIQVLAKTADSDPGQEVQGIALPVLDAVLVEA